jgi:predicted nucleic acid-binding protein
VPKPLPLPTELVAPVLALELGMDTTFGAEYVALAQLQKGTLVSADERLLKRVGDLVPTAAVDTLAV